MKDSFIILSPNNLTSSYTNNSNYSSDRNNLYQHQQQQQQQPRNTFKSNNQVLAAAAAAVAQQQQQQQQRQMSANNTGGSTSQRYKTELCRPFMEYNHCKYDDKCQFAHGINELRNLSRHPKYKTELCKTFHSHGLCPYGHRCHFIHNNQNHPGGSPPTNNNINSNHGNSNSGGIVTNPALILSEIGQNSNHHLKHNNSGNNWSINYYNAYEDNSKAIGTSSSLSSDENLSLCSSPTSSDSSSSGSGPGTFSIVPFEIVGQKGFTEQMQHPHHHQYQEPESEHILNMGQLDQHNNITLEQFNNSRLPIFSSMLLRK